MRLYGCEAARATVSACGFGNARLRGRAGVSERLPAQSSRCDSVRIIVRKTTVKDVKICDSTGPEDARPCEFEINFPTPSTPPHV